MKPSREFTIEICYYNILHGVTMKAYKWHTLVAIHTFRGFTSDAQVVKQANHFRSRFRDKDSKVCDCVAYIPIYAASLIEIFKHNGYDVIGEISLNHDRVISMLPLSELPPVSKEGG